MGECLLLGLTPPRFLRTVDATRRACFACTIASELQNIFISEMTNGKQLITRCAGTQYLLGLTPSPDTFTVKGVDCKLLNSRLDCN